VRSYRTFSPSPPVRAGGCLFSVALSVGSVVSRPRVSPLSFEARGYAASRPVVFGLSSQPFLKPINPADLTDFRKGRAILCPSKTGSKLLEKLKFFKTNVLEKSIKPAFHY
jgi:hypothetical protein